MISLVLDKSYEELREYYMRLTSQSSQLDVLIKKLKEPTNKY